MIQRKAIPLLVLIIGLVSQPEVKGGECLYDREDFIAALEAGVGSELFDGAIYCLCQSPIIRTEYWAGPNAAAVFRECRNDPLRPRIIAATAALLHTSWAGEAENRQVLCRLVARFGVAQLDTFDVFAEVVASTQGNYHGGREELAILRDCRAVDVLLDEYRMLRTIQYRGDFDGAIDILSCLYHIPCERAILAAKTLLAEEDDQKLRSRIQLVIDR